MEVNEPDPLKASHPGGTEILHCGPARLPPSKLRRGEDKPEMLLGRSQATDTLTRIRGLS